MSFKIELFVSVFLIFNVQIFSSSKTSEDNGKSSLVFVFDTTGSMYNDLRQLREGAELILNTALEESNVIEDFVFVPFHDPAVGPATVTKKKDVFKSALNIVHVYGGGDCPEKSLGGILLALSVSRPRSFVYVFTDATAGDHRLVGRVLDSVQRKQSQVVFVLTGHCNDLHRPSYKVYQQIAAASSGQVFNLNKTSVHKVLDFVRSSIKGRTVNLGSVVNPAGYNHSQEIPIDSTLGELTVSVSGAKPSIRVLNPGGVELTGPPKLITTLDLSEIMVVKVLQPEPGNWTIVAGSEEDHSVKVVGLSNLTFTHGFSVEKPGSMGETSYRPLQGSYNHLMLKLTQIDTPVTINYAEILTLNGSTLFEIPLREVDAAQKIYLADPFVPPDDFFYVAIKGHDENNHELRRIGSTAVQVKPPDVPYLTVQRKVEGRSHERIVLRCNIESLVPVTASWTKDSLKIQDQISSLQSTYIEYVIKDLSEGDVGLYQCVAKNIAGVGKAITDVTLLVDPPQVTLSPENITLQLGESVVITCTALTEVLLFKFQLSFNGTLNHYVSDIHLEPNIDGIYKYNKTVQNVTEKESGTYTCHAANRGGQTTQSTHITIQAQPTAQILGPHTITKSIHSNIQLVCNVENADRVTWVASNSTTVRENRVNGSVTDVLDLEAVQEDGVWTCVALRDSFRVSDSVEVIVLMKPEVEIEGTRNITVLNGTTYEITCNIVAKPTPRILWHRETERFLQNNIINLSDNVYKSVLILDSAKEAVNGTYFCIGENSEGIDEDTVVVGVRRKMVLIDGFTDKSVQLYSKIDLHCRVDSYPPPQIHWFHNGTILNLNNNIQLSDNNSTLNVNRVDFDHLGLYTCEADNGFERLNVEGRINVYGLEIPLVSKEPVRQITEKGKSAIITCRVIKGNPEPTITWQYRTKTSGYSALPLDVVTSANKLELLISEVKVEHAGTYRCIADNAVGRDEYDVLFVVQFPPKFTKMSTVEEVPMEIKAGERVKFTCEATGFPPPVVIWTKDYLPVHYSRNVYLSENDLIVEKATENDTGLFTCNATSALGSSQRNFTLVVYVPPIITPPEMEPELEVLEGQLVELPCIVTGIPKPMVQWLQNGEVVSEERKYAHQYGLRFIANLTDFGEYTCMVTNQYGNTSFTYTVYVWVPPYIEPPLETRKDVLIGSNVSLHCDAVGFPVPTMFWEFRDKILVENTTDLSFNEVGNVFVKNVSSKHEGLFVCIAENIVGVAKKAIYLNVNEPPVILQDNYTGPYIATDKDTALTISCRAAGKPKPFIVWSKDKVFLDKDSRYDIDTDGTLTIKSPSEDLSGVYTCVAKNAVGQVNRTVAVEIYSLPSRVQSEESQATATVVEGTNASIECPIKASHTDIVKWYKDAKLTTQGKLRIPNISRHNASTYACTVTNKVSSAYSSMYISVEWPPSFTTSDKERIFEGNDKSDLIQDTGGEKNLESEEVHNVEVVKGDDWYFDCKVDANPTAKTKWLFNSKLIPGEDKDRLKLLNIQQYNSGNYKCIVSNNHGTIVRKFTLNVLVPPFISEFDLLDVQLKEGSNATLECNARGSPKPDIEWIYEYNGTKWDENYTSLTNVSLQSAGLYHCKAQNKAGAAHIVYRVSVVVPAKIKDMLIFKEIGDTDYSHNMDLVLGSRVRLSCTATGNPIPKIQWIRNGNTLSENNFNISYADLILDKVKTSDAGSYVCVATNEGGVDEKQVKLDVLEPPKIFQTLFQSTNISTLEVISGQTFYLHCHPYGNPFPQIYWFFNGLPLKLFDDSMVSKEFGEVLVSEKARYGQSGNYTCVARNAGGNASVVYLVDVLVPPPTLKDSIKSVTTRVGKPLHLTCPIEGSPLPNVMWIKHPYTEIGDDTPRIQLVDYVSLVINKTEIQDSGKYSCIMTNKVGTTEVIFEVVVEMPPSIAGGMVESHVVQLHRSIVLKCQADGNPTPKISWLKDTQQLSENLSNIQRVLGNSLLAVWSASVRDAGQYICVAENSAGTQHRRFNVALKVPGKWKAWSQWSYCNVTCGLGYQMRSRICHYVDDYNITHAKMTKSDRIILDDTACKGPANDRRKCHMPPCEDETQMRWSAWSKWSECSATCGVGTQARTRRCKTRAKCVGDNVQIRRCSDLPKCLRSLGSSENEIYSSGESIDTAETIASVPEAGFETRPDLNSNSSPDVEEFQLKPESKYSMIYYHVNVTDNLDGSDRGSCDPGLTHNRTTGSCDDIDECLLEKNKCHSTQVCVNVAGAYECGCVKGFVSLGAGQRCLDINECEQDIDGCEYACVNVAGGYVCACPGDMRLHTDKHRCIAHINECEQDIDVCEYACVNVAGGYVWACPGDMSLHAASLHKTHSHEEDYSEYLSTAIEFPTRYNRYRS